MGFEVIDGGGEFDPFELAEPVKGYSSEKFYVRSGGRNSGGNNVNVQVQIAADVHGELAALVQSGKIPDYRTAQDVFRDAIIHRLHFLREHIKSPSLDRMLDSEMRLAEVERRMAKMEAIVKLIKAIDNELAAYLEGEDWLMFDEAYSQHVVLVENLREPYRAQLTSVLRQHRKARQVKGPEGNDQW